MLVATLLAIAIGAPHEAAIDAAEKVEADRLVSWVEQLQALQTRVTGTDGARKARDLIAAELERLGYDVERQPTVLKQVFADELTWVGSENLIATLGPRHRRLVLIAHLDTKAARDASEAAELGWRWHTDPAPGADDNASGTAALLEVARVFAAHAPSMSMSMSMSIGLDIVFAGGEEMAIVQVGNWMVNIGAEKLAMQYVSTQVDIVGALSVDMLLRARPYGSSFRVYSDGRLGSSRFSSAIQVAAHLVAPAATVTEIVDPSFAWSDHGSFWARGWPGVLFIEDDFHHVRYHRSTDHFAPTDSFYDRAQLAAGARIITAAVVLLLAGG